MFHHFSKHIVVYCSDEFLNVYTANFPLTSDLFLTSAKDAELYYLHKAVCKIGSYRTVYL